MSAVRAFRQAASNSGRVARSSSSTTSASLLRSRLVSSSRAAVYVRPQLSAARAFSVSAHVSGQGANVSLAQKLAEELKFEQTDNVNEEVPGFLKEFRNSKIWEIEDVEGNDEVALKRTFGNESIRLVFSIVDIQTPDENQFDEELEGEAEEDEEVSKYTYPIRTSFTISKSNAPGALSIEALCQDGTFIIDNISFYNDAKLSTELTAEADWKRRGLYLGPQFDTLDVSVQEEFEKFLQERDIHERLAFFIPEYAEYKEQKEYVKWLGNVKSFVEA